MNKYRSIFIIIFTTMFFVCRGGTGTIRGNVYDKIERTGLFGAIVQISETRKAVITDLDGNFKFDSIPPGTYTLTARYVGYGDTTIFNVPVSADSITNVKFILPPPCSYDEHRDNKTCPICKKKNKVVPIVYGLPLGPMNTKKYYYAGCQITNCDPHWYCKRDDHKF